VFGGDGLKSNPTRAPRRALPRRRTLCTNSKNPRYGGNFSCEIPRCGRSQDRSSDQNASIVLTCTSQNPSRWVGGQRVARQGRVLFLPVVSLCAVRGRSGGLPSAFRILCERARDRSTAGDVEEASLCPIPGPRLPVLWAAESAFLRRRAVTGNLPKHGVMLLYRAARDTSRIFRLAHGGQSTPISEAGKTINLLGVRFLGFPGISLSRRLNR
jgi:hypothetical protein